MLQTQSLLQAMHATADLNLRQVNYLVNKQREIQIQMESELKKNNIAAKS
jgi:hypothetical protein